jgi:hypothetical protein
VIFSFLFVSSRFQFQLEPTERFNGGRLILFVPKKKFCTSQSCQRRACTAASFGSRRYHLPQSHNSRSTSLTNFIYGCNFKILSMAVISKFRQVFRLAYQSSSCCPTIFLSLTGAMFVCRQSGCFLMNQSSGNSRLGLGERIA